MRPWLALAALVAVATALTLRKEKDESVRVVHPGALSGDLAVNDIVLEVDGRDVKTLPLTEVRKALGVRGTKADIRRRVTLGSGRSGDEAVPTADAWADLLYSDLDGAFVSKRFYELAAKYANYIVHQEHAMLLGVVLTSVTAFIDETTKLKLSVDLSTNSGDCDLLRDEDPDTLEVFMNGELLSEELGHAWTIEEKLPDVKVKIILDDSWYRPGINYLAAYCMSGLEPATLHAAGMVEYNFAQSQFPWMPPTVGPITLKLHSSRFGLEAAGKPRETAVAATSVCQRLRRMCVHAATLDLVAAMNPDISRGRVAVETMDRVKECPPVVATEDDKEDDLPDPCPHAMLTIFITDPPHASEDGYLAIDLAEDLVTSHQLGNLQHPFAPALSSLVWTMNPKVAWENFRKWQPEMLKSSHIRRVRSDGCDAFPRGGEEVGGTLDIVVEYGLLKGASHSELLERSGGFEEDSVFTRQEEILEALQWNICHPSVRRIWVFGSRFELRDLKSRDLFDHDKKMKPVIVPEEFGADVPFSFLHDHMRRFPGRDYIMLNHDIVLGRTFDARVLNNMPDQQAVILSRFEVGDEADPRPSIFPCCTSPFSFHMHHCYDAYAFRSPVPESLTAQLNFSARALGGSEFQQVYVFEQAGWCVANLCRSLPIFHHHISKWRRTVNTDATFVRYQLPNETNTLIATNSLFAGMARSGLTHDTIHAGTCSQAHANTSAVVFSRYKEFLKFRTSDSNASNTTNGTTSKQ